MSTTALPAYSRWTRHPIMAPCSFPVLTMNHSFFMSLIHGPALASNPIEE
jgi:hypothetical protein